MIATEAVIARLGNAVANATSLAPIRDVCAMFAAKAIITIESSVSTSFASAAASLFRGVVALKVLLFVGLQHLVWFIAVSI